MKRYTVLAGVISAGLIQSCAMERSPASISGDTRPCVANYSTTGGFWAGKQFKTFEAFPTVPPATAFVRIGGEIAANGYQIISSNKDLGIISASNAVVSPDSKTVPLNAVIRNDGNGGSRVELLFSLSTGLVTSADGVQNTFCKLLSAVSS
jgi:hypothetical protein